MLLNKVKCATAVLLAVGILGTLAIAFVPHFLDVKAQAGETTSQSAKSKGERSKLTAVMVQDFEKATSTPAVWVVNIPNENASVQFSADHRHDGKQSLKLHYHFLGAGQFQYLGVPNKTRIQATVHKLHFWLRGDNSKCSYGVQVSDASGETHQYSKNTGQCGLIDFAGWREVVIDLDSPHETWGGDKNGKADYPLNGIAFTVGQPTDLGRLLPAEGDLYFDGLSVNSEKTAEETLGCQVAVLSPGYGSEVRGDTRVAFAAPGFRSVTVKCWKGGGGYGADSRVATVRLDAKGNGSFVFPADAYPHGPITVRISGNTGSVKDNCYLQLYFYCIGEPERRNSFAISYL